jgi:poly(hydroxyalkanoate) depolymerase family esterase
MPRRQSGLRWASTISPVSWLLNFRGCKLPSSASSVDETGVCRSGGLCMSSVGWRRFAEHTMRGRGAARQRRSAKGRRPWVPRRPTVLRWRRPAPAGAQVGTWDQLVDEGPTGSRSFAVYTPPGLRPGTAVPLVVILHGCKQSAQDAALGTGTNALADREGFVALYPEQSAHDNPQRCWNWFDPRHQVRGSGEPAAIAGITQRILSGHAGARLDPNRVHVMGLSAGGAMAGILGATYPDLYASVGIHSAPQYRAARNSMTALLAMKNGGPHDDRTPLEPSLRVRSTIRDGCDAPDQACNVIATLMLLRSWPYTPHRMGYHQ